ncbi:MAG: sugar phosphate nucleotidyltransferase [Bacteroidia bacterium]|nr:sugar phosphate nucleotidyltransferase [Bacteroidia bacterium]
MNLIIPMAGEGKRLRPHTFTLPKPLFPLLEKPVLQWLVEEVYRALSHPVQAMVYVIRDLRAEHRRFLEELARRWEAEAHFVEQTEPLGTAHAIYQAKAFLSGPCVILFADTIFRASIQVPEDADGALWVKRVEDPRSYGVIELSTDGYIQRLVEKPEVPPSDLAIIGIYYLREAERLLPAIEYLFQHQIRSKGEYQLTDALQWLCDQGLRLRALPVEDWLDCGSRPLILRAQARLLDLNGSQPPPKLAGTVQVIPPSYIGEKVDISESIIGPYAVIESGAKVYRSVLSHTLCRKGAHVEECILHEALIGSYAHCRRAIGTVDLGDYSRYG